MTLFLWYIWVATLSQFSFHKRFFSQTCFVSSFFYSFVPSSAVPVSDATRISNIYSLWDLIFVFKSLKKYLVISTISYFFFYLFQNDSSSGLIALLHLFFFPPTSTLPFIWVSLSNREVEFGVVYKAEQRQKLVLTTLSWLSKIQFLKVLHHVHSSLH